MPAWSGIQPWQQTAPAMQNQLFEAALGISKPWYVRGVDFDAARKVLTIGIDFVAGSRFPAPGVGGAHPVHDTQIKRLRHRNFFQHECYLEVRTPRVKLADGRVVQIEPDWFGKLALPCCSRRWCWRWRSR
jgi:transposase